MKVRNFSIVLIFMLIFYFNGIHRLNGKINYVPFHQVKVTDDFWAPRLAVNCQITTPHNLEKCREVGIIDNFAVAAGLKTGGYTGLSNWDEFLYKTIEAAAYCLMQQPHPKLATQLDSIISIISAAQEPDGYLRTNFTIALTRQQDADYPARWSNLQNSLELYSAGHLYEAAVAHYQATGQRTLLEVALKNATLVDSLFGPDKRVDVPGHEEIELALIKLFDVTGEERWWKLAKFFIDQRGNPRRPRLYGPFHQDHQPLVMQTEAVGQAPRATYLYSGAADVAYINEDPRYINALNRLWEDVVTRKMYITGGIGSLHANEGFGPAFELPNQTAYTEICAAISFSLWNARLFKLQPAAKYFDVLERTLYNNFLAGVSLSGDRYFYACPPESDGQFKFNLGWFPKGFEHLSYKEASATRKEWFPCACCPPNLARCLPQIPGLVYAVNADELFVNLFMASSARFVVKEGSVHIQQETNYPWQGRIRLTISPDHPTEFVLKIRIPGWAQGRPVPGDLYFYRDDKPVGWTLLLNGKALYPSLENGFAALKRTWQKGDVIELNFPLSIRRVLARAEVKEDVGKVALERGPVVFCAEGIDNHGRALNILLPDSTRLRPEFRPDLLGGVMVITGQALGLERSPDGQLTSKEQTFLAIPYAVWSNRGAGEMAVWLWRDFKSARERM